LSIADPVKNDSAVGSDAAVIQIKVQLRQIHQTSSPTTMSTEENSHLAKTKKASF